MDEEHSKAEGRGEMSETELLIMDQFTILVRDLYAFYPLLIRFVDYNRYLTPTRGYLNTSFLSGTATYDLHHSAFLASMHVLPSVPKTKLCIQLQ